MSHTVVSTMASAFALALSGACHVAADADAERPVYARDVLHGAAAHANANASSPAESEHAVAVQPRKAILEDRGSFPCSECHDESLPNDLRERELTEAHDDIKLVHGAGQLWCTTCHHEDRGMLKNRKGAPIDFDASFVMCGECHFEQRRDFDHGAHGKRIGTWQSDGAGRTALACAACHDAHDPSIKQRLPWRAARTPDASISAHPSASPGEHAGARAQHDGGAHE